MSGGSSAFGLGLVVFLALGVVILLFLSNLLWDGVLAFTIMDSIYSMTCVYKMGLRSPCLTIKANELIKKTSFWSIKPRYAIVCVYIVHNSVHPIARIRDDHAM